MKRNVLFVAMLGLVLALGMSSCASAPLGFFGPKVVLSEVNGNSIKTGTATGTVVFGVFGKVSYPSISTAAKNGGITKVATVEYYKKPGFLYMWTDYTTIVTGE